MKYHPNMTLADFFKFIFVPQKLAKLSKASEANYQTTVNAFVRRFGASITCAAITPGMLDDFQQWRVDIGFAKSAVHYRSNMVVIMMAARQADFTKKTGHPIGEHFPNRNYGRKTVSHAAAAGTPGTLWHLFQTSYRPKKLRGGSSRTSKQYRIQLNHFAKYLGSEPTLADLTEDVVSAFLDKHAEGRSPYTTNKAYWCLMALWRHAAKKRLVDEFPTIPAMREPTRIPQAWTIDDLAKLFDSCRQEPGRIEGVPAADWWYALHMLCWTTGERVGAAMAVRTADVNLDRGEILIPAEVRKGKSQDMLYRLRPEAIQAIASIREPERDMLFPWRGCRRSTFYHHYKRLLLRAGLPTDRKCKPQKLRRSFASYVEAAGGNATAALAHSSRSIAIKSYLDPRICGGRNPSDLLPELPARKEESA